MFNEKDYFGDTWYLQTDKIDEMYGKAVKRVEEQIITQKSGLLKTFLGSNVNLGNILKHLLIDLKIDASLTKENAKSDKIIQILSPHEKFHIALKALEKAGLCCDLNKSLRQNKKVTPYIYFKGRANFSLSEKKSNIVLVKGMVDDCKFQCYCSEVYFTKISSSLYITLLSASDLLKSEYLDVFCIGTIIGQPQDNEKKLLLKLSYIRGSIEDIHLIYKTKG